MDAPAGFRRLYDVGVVLLLTFDLLTCVHSQGASDDVWFSLSGTTYQNNSCVTLEDIGEDDTALFCVTNLTTCCRPPYTVENETGLGNWYFPNGTVVPSRGMQWDFHRTRGQMVVSMHRRRGGVAGVYRCVIPDSMSVTQTIYIGVYTVGTGDVWFSLNGTVYQNNSCVTLEDIGEGNDTALRCITNFTACCKPPHTGENGPGLGNWFFPNGTIVLSSGTHRDIYRTRGQMVVYLNRIRGGVAGIYRCDIPDSTNVTQSIYIGVYTAGTGDVWFSLRGTTYQNNSCVTLEDIGEENDTALLCMTNFTACCRRPYTGENGTGLGNWYFPNGDEVFSRGKNRDFYRTRGQMVIRMHRRRGGEDGIYSCEIPDSTNVLQTIYIGVYTAGTASIIPFQTVEVSLPLWTVGATCPPQTVGATSPPQTVGTTSPSQTVGTTSPPQTVGATSPPQTVGTTSPPQTVGATCPPQTVGATSPPQTVGTTSPPQTVGATCPPQTVGATSPPQTVGATSPPQTVGATSPPQTVEATTTTGTASVTSSTQPTTNSPSDGTITTTVITVVAVVIILVVIVVGVVILVVLFRAKKRKQLLEISKLQNVTMENEDFEIKLKQEGTTDMETSFSADQPLYAEVQTEALPNVPSKSEKLVSYSNHNSTVNGGYSEIEPKPADSKRALPAKPPRQVSLSDPMSEEMEPSLMYQNMDQHCDPPSTTNDVYTVPDTTSSHTVEIDSGKYETVYSEPIEPSLFTNVFETPSHSEDLQPYAPIYTVPTDLPKSDKVLLKVFDSNIQKIRELGMGHFGKIILAETVGLSAKDLRLSESDDDKSKPTLVAVKKLKSDALNATKEAFEKEVNFMSRLSDKNVIRILGVCYEDTPFIMMEYMEKGDLNQYLQRFKALSTTDSESQGQITTSTLVHMTTQIASAMKYLASHNFVHRDLATRNCLVGPNYLVKISDFGMSRSLYDSHYYRIHGRFALPVRWMSIECFYGKFSQKSDVWAFGVTMWEIFTLAKEQPYNDMSDKQVVEDALKGKNRKTLARPDMCPLKVYKIMLECWEHNSNQRATFEQLFQMLISIHQDV